MKRKNADFIRKMAIDSLVLKRLIFCLKQSPSVPNKGLDNLVSACRKEMEMKYEEEEK